MSALASPCDRSDVHVAHSWAHETMRCPGVIQRIPTRAEWQAWLEARAISPPEAVDFAQSIFPKTPGEATHDLTADPEGER